jgi:DNA-binding NarL/FixJ family response regulator
LSGVPAVGRTGLSNFRRRKDVVSATEDTHIVEDHSVDSLLSVLRINGGVVIRPRHPDTTPIDAQPLTEREREVLSLVAEGYSNKLIAARLGISERTVKNHLTYIMIKLRASDRTHAVVTAVRLGWLAI